MLNNQISQWCALQFVSDGNMYAHYLNMTLQKTIKDLAFSTSIIAMTLSLFVRRTCITFSQVDRKFPSIPLTSIAFTSILVKRKGTCITIFYIRKLAKCNQMTTLTWEIVSRKKYMNIISPCKTSLNKWTHTFSGNFSRVIEASKQSPKSICKIFPLQNDEW